MTGAFSVTLSLLSSSTPTELPPRTKIREAMVEVTNERMIDQSHLASQKKVS